MPSTDTYCRYRTHLEGAVDGVSAIDVTTPGDVLNAEHEAIETLLTTVDAMAERLRAGEPIPKDDLYDVLTVVVDFADGCHHAKEESIVFPALALVSPHAGAELGRRLTSDHRALRLLASSVKATVPRSHTKAARKQLGKLLATYSRLLRAHMKVETERLLPEVALALTAAEQERIMRAFERVEREEIGAGMQAAYRAIILRLAETYSVTTVRSPA